MPIKSTLPLIFNHSAHLLGGSQSVHRIHCDAVLVLPSQRLHHEAQESGGDVAVCSLVTAAVLHSLGDVDCVDDEQHCSPYSILM